MELRRWTLFTRRPHFSLLFDFQFGRQFDHSPILNLVLNIFLNIVLNIVGSKKASLQIVQTVQTRSTLWRSRCAQSIL